MERVRMGDPFLWIPGRRAPSGGLVVEHKPAASDG